MNENEVQKAYEIWKDRSLENIEMNLKYIVKFPATAEAIRRILKERKCPNLRGFETALTRAGVMQ